jgi:hypothetical protein
MIFIAAGCSGQTVHSPVQATYTAFGAYSNHCSDVFSFTGNQAKLSSLQTPGAGIYAERKFLLRELNFYSLVLAVPMASGGFGLQADYFGFADYNESKLGIAYGKKLGKLIDIGVQFNYYMVHIASYGNAATINFETGIILHPAEHINIGLHVYNPVGGKLGKNTGEKLASIYKAGIGYDASEQVCLSIEIIKEEDKPVDVQADLQYVFAKRFFARMGMATASASPYAGGGWSWKNFRMHISVSYHSRLGFTPGLLLLADLKNNNQQ